MQRNLPGVEPSPNETSLRNAKDSGLLPGVMRLLMRFARGAMVRDRETPSSACHATGAAPMPRGHRASRYRGPGAMKISHTARGISIWGTVAGRHRPFIDITPCGVR